MAQTELTEKRPSRAQRWNVIRLVRALPIRWRIFSIAALNSAVVLILAGLIWNGAKVLSAAWDEVRQVRESDKILVVLESEAGRLQNLIHRYINQASPEIFAEILLLREAVVSTLRTRGGNDPMLAGSVEELARVTERFFDGFGDLRTVQATIAQTYENEVLKPAKEMSGLYAIIDDSATKGGGLIAPSLGKSREAFTQTLVAANAYYLSLATDAATEAKANIATIERTVPVMIDLAENDLQRAALRALGTRAAAFRGGLDKLAGHFADRTILLQTAIDANQTAMVSVIDQLSQLMGQREQRAQARFDRTLADIYERVAIVATAFLSVIVLSGIAIGRSIRVPLSELKSGMSAIVAGDYGREIQGTTATDEIGEMARAVAVFRDNAIAKRKAEDELRAAKERAETALAELREAQRSLVDAEKLAALGGLVAGVAHEVNNPIGISLTVASSFARRSEGPLRKSRLEEFVESNRVAAQQLVTNLQRAGDLVQSFKQVAVDRSHADRRQFDLREATDQITASLRPALKRSPVALEIDMPSGILMDSFPGSYGQVLTNLFLNAVTHAFPEGKTGIVTIAARPLGASDVEIVISDDGIGMPPEVQRQAFDPFFTTRRNKGGTGLGLHIVYNLVTQQLGGRVNLHSEAGRGTAFNITIPRIAPHRAGEAGARQQTTGL
jgi:signal transduction histidine kinase